MMKELSLTPLMTISPIFLHIMGRRKNYYEHPREDAIIMTREFEQHGTENPVS